jgi:hypothetical protein
MSYIEKIKEKLGDYNVLLKHMDFLQNNGFTDYGKGHIVGQIELLEEYLSEAGKNQEEAIEMKSEKSRNIKETMVVADKSSRVQEEKQGRDSGSRGRMVADITYEKGKIVISKGDSNNSVGNNNIDYYYNESNPDLPERQRQQFIKAEYSKKIDDNNNIMNNELSSQKESQIAQVLYSPSNNDTTDEDRNNYNKLKVKEVHDLKMQDNKVTKQSWRERIKGMANNIEDWR